MYRRSSKIVGICDAAGRLVDFVLVAGQAHELAPSLQLLKRLPKAPAWAIADMACDAAEFRVAAEGWARPRSCHRARTPNRKTMPRLLIYIIQTEKTMPRLLIYIIQSPQSDRAVLVPFERVAGDCHSLRQDRDVLCGEDCHLGNPRLA